MAGDASAASEPRANATKRSVPPRALLTLTDEEWEVYSLQRDERRRDHEALGRSSSSTTRSRPATGGLSRQARRRGHGAATSISSTPNPEAIERIVPLVRSTTHPSGTSRPTCPTPWTAPRRGVHPPSPPAIDLLSPKNMALPPEDAAFVCDQFGIDVDRLPMCQVSRFDPERPTGVIDAYRLVIRRCSRSSSP